MSLYIDGNWVNGNGDLFTSVNPANQEIVWQGNSATQSDVNLAIKSSVDSFLSWSQLSLVDRCHYIEKYVKVLETKQLEYAQTISIENGKPLWEAKTEVAAMLGKFNASLNAYNSRTGEAESKAEISNKLVHRPIGVMVVFGPFNFPGHLPNGHIIPALLAGNTVVFKPSELTPKCAELMLKYWEQAGLPAGVINLVQGGPEVGKALIASNKINGVLFTGSYKVGQSIHQALAGRVDVMLALEMGGNNPLIIDKEINNLDAAIYNTIQSVFITAGQRCTCAKRLYVPEGDFGDKFINKLVEVTRNLAISDGYNKLNVNGTEDAFMGSVISLQAKENILGYKNNLLSQYRSEELLESKGFSDNSALLSPGIIAMHEREQSDMECFGPILQIYRYDSIESAVNEANNTAYGLSAGLLSDSKESIDYFHKYIRAGIVNWNRPTTGAAGSLPFGGIGHSGNYRPSASYAADYCAYPMASQFCDELVMPDNLTPGVSL